MRQEEPLMINGLNNTNSAASIVLDAANKVNNGFTKSWNDMSFAEKLLKILSLGLWSPKYSPSEKQEYQELLSVLKPVSPKSNELGRVYAQFSDGSSLRISVTRSELIEAEIITPDNKKTTVLLESNQENRLLNSLPVDRHMPYILVHNSLSEMDLTTLAGMHNQLSLTSSLSATVIPHTPQTDPLGGSAPFSSVFMDACRGLGTAKLSINGVDIPGEAQETLRNALGLRSTNSSPAQYVVENGISRHYAEMVAQNSSGTDAQKDQLVDFLCQPGAATAICSAFYQSFNVPSLTLTHTRVAQASQLNAGNSQPLPNACLNISLSQTPGGDIYVASHTGVQIMAPEDRPNELGMLTNRTTYTVPKDLKCKINDMVSAIKPQYAASETYP